MTLGKEVQLKHRAPVLAIQILDGSCIPVTSMSQSGMYILQIYIGTFFCLNFSIVNLLNFDPFHNN